MKDSLKKGLFLGVIVVLLAEVLIVKRIFLEKDFHAKYAGYDLDEDVEGTEREGTYTIYLGEHPGAACPARDVDIPVTEYVSAKDAEVYADYEGEQNVLYTGADSEVSWEFDIPEAGFYNIYMEYMTVESRGVAAERAVRINGELPFSDAANIIFTRIWKNKGEPRADNQGNEIRPAQVEEYAWQGAYYRDDMGYITEPYQFYFEKGKNTLSLEAVNEPLVLKSLCVRGREQGIKYREYAGENAGKDATDEGLSYIQKIQGEDSTLCSESSLYAKYDRSSPTTQPYSVTNTLLNYVGGDAWHSSGQWIEWEFEVPEDGYYNITIKGRQNYARGSVSSRCLYIDGEVPFDEVKEISFDYSNDWKLLTLADTSGTPYDFYLKAGKHTIRLEATLGSMGSILETMEDSTYRLNQIYRKLLIYTGPNPDKYRDYNVDKVYPEIIEAMSLESKRLYKVVDDMVLYTGQKADKIATAQTLAQQLERFVDRPEKITLEFSPTFKDNITALGTATLNMSETKLDVDYLVVTGKNAKPEKDSANGFGKAVHELRSFAASFYVDYDAVGDVYDEDSDDVVSVWVLTGRDQGTILKSMIDDTFTPETGVKVNVEIVAPDALLSAVVAGRGPNVVLSVGGDQPVNYALRNASEDLTQFDDFDEVIKSYTESSYAQYRLGDGVYGISETQTFNVMFYRTDILEELGLEVPQTWQELIEMLPTIQGNNMSIGIPSAAGSSNAGPSTAAISMTARPCRRWLTMRQVWQRSKIIRSTLRTMASRYFSIS